MPPPCDAPIYAHTLQGQPSEQWKLLDTYAATAAKLAGAFGAER